MTFRSLSPQFVARNIHTVIFLPMFVLVVVVDFAVISCFVGFCWFFLIFVDFVIFLFVPGLFLGGLILMSFLDSCCFSFNFYFLGVFVSVIGGDFVAFLFILKSFLESYCFSFIFFGGVGGLFLLLGDDFVAFCEFLLFFSWFVGVFFCWLCWFLFM